VFDKYLAVDGIEVINGARSGAYITSLLGGIDILCPTEGMAAALGHSEYISPEDDSAPWYSGQRLAASRFYGLFPGRVEGAEGSTREVIVTELSGDGAVSTSPRHAAREMRVIATAFAADEEAMMEGMAWLSDVLAGDGCSDAELGCTGREVKMFAAAPGDDLEAYSLARTFYDVEVTSAPKVTLKHPSKRGVIWQIEFLLTAGRPWAFTALADVGTLDMDTAANYQDPADEDCSAALSAYDEFVADPYFTAISRPPRPPVILPPNILDLSSWRRLVLPIPATVSKRWGRAVPVVKVGAWDQAIQYLRIRFYRDQNGVSGCDFDGEAVISYIPAGAFLTLDAIRRIAFLTLPTGQVVPAGHLLFGSGGRPFLWPSLGCQHNYTMTADLMPGQSGVTVELQTAVRE
jgi:hypothetical protein